MQIFKSFFERIKNLFTQPNIYPPLKAKTSEQEPEQTTSSNQNSSPSQTTPTEVK